MSRKIAIIGLGFGDEGKGMVTSALSALRRNPLVVRFSGGHQAGHTAHWEGKRHVFANLGAGTLQGIPTYWSHQCTFDPVGFNNELKVLLDTMGDDLDDIMMYIDDECPVTTPFEIFSNQNDVDTLDHGSCGVGYGATIQREEDNIHLCFGDLFNPAVTMLKLEQIKKYYTSMLHFRVDLEPFAEAVRDIINPKYFPNGVVTRVSCKNDPEALKDLFTSYATILFEGSQGLLLDKDYGFFPHVTRSNVGVKAINSLGTHLDEVVYVTRAYQTRHGNGPMTNEDHELYLVDNSNESNVNNEYQGKFRTSPLDLDLLEYAVRKNRLDLVPKGVNKPMESLVITCMDQMKSYKSTRGGAFQKITPNVQDIPFDNQDEFVKSIVDALEIDGNVYLSRSNNSELIEWR